MCLWGAKKLKETSGSHKLYLIWSITGNLSPASKTLLCFKLQAASTKWIRRLSQTPHFQLLLCCTRWAALPAATASTSVYYVHCCWPAWPVQISPSEVEVLSENRSSVSWLLNYFFHHFWWLAMESLFAGRDFVFPRWKRLLQPAVLTAHSLSIRFPPAAALRGYAKPDNIWGK